MAPVPKSKGKSFEEVEAANSKLASERELLAQLAQTPGNNNYQDKVQGLSVFYDKSLTEFGNKADNQGRTGADAAKYATDIEFSRIYLAHKRAHGVIKDMAEADRKLAAELSELTFVKGKPDLVFDEMDKNYDAAQKSIPLYAAKREGAVKALKEKKVVAILVKTSFAPTKGTSQEREAQAVDNFLTFLDDKVRPAAQGGFKLIIGTEIPENMSKFGELSNITVGDNNLLEFIKNVKSDAYNAAKEKRDAAPKKEEPEPQMEDLGHFAPPAPLTQAASAFIKSK